MEERVVDAGDGAQVLGRVPVQVEVPDRRVQLAQLGRQTDCVSLEKIFAITFN